MVDQRDNARRAVFGYGLITLCAECLSVGDEFERDFTFVRCPGGFDDIAARFRAQPLITREKFLDLHWIVGKGLGGGIDRGQPAADHDDRQAQLHVGERVGFRGAGQLQRHQKIRRRAHTVGKPVRQFQHRRLARARGKGDVIEAKRERAVHVDRAAKANATIERKMVTPLEQQSNHLKKILVPAHGNAVFGDAAEASHRTFVKRLDQCCKMAHRFESDTRPVRFHSAEIRIERLDLETVDAHDGVSVVQQMMRKRKARRTHADNQRSLAGWRHGQRTP